MGIKVQIWSQFVVFIKVIPLFPQWPLDFYLLSAYYMIYTADSNTRGTQKFRFIKE